MASVLASPGWLLIDMRSIPERWGGLPVCHLLLQCCQRGTRPFSFSPTLTVIATFGCGSIATSLYFKKLHGGLPKAYTLFPSIPPPRVRCRPTLPRSWQSYGCSIPLQMMAEPRGANILAPQGRALLVPHTLTMSPTLSRTQRAFFLEERTSWTGDSVHSGFPQAFTMPELMERRVPSFKLVPAYVLCTTGN